jgi:hypothetical protein
MILYYNTEGHMRRALVCWLPQVSHEGGERRCRMKSFRLGGGPLLDLVSALAPQRLSSHRVPTSQTDSFEAGLSPCGIGVHNEVWVRVGNCFKGCLKVVQ